MVSAPTDMSTVWQHMETLESALPELKLVDFLSASNLMVETVPASGLEQMLFSSAAYELFSQGVSSDGVPPV